MVPSETSDGSPRLELDTIPDTQAYLKISRAKVYELLADGSLKSIKIGASRRVIRSSVDEFVRRQLAAAK